MCFTSSFFFCTTIVFYTKLKTFLKLSGITNRISPSGHMQISPILQALAAELYI